MKLSFGMIFSILLIIAFLAFAFFGIKQFLDMQQKALYLKFQEDLKEDVNIHYIGEQGSKSFVYDLPNKVTDVCFVNNNPDNLAISFSDEPFPERLTIPKIDLTQTIRDGSKICFTPEDNKIKLHLVKEFGENLVTIKRSN